MPVVAGDGKKGFSSSKSNYTKKLQCAKLNVRLATVHKGSTQEDVLMKNQENDTFSLAQGKYPWGIIINSRFVKIVSSSPVT